MKKTYHIITFGCQMNKNDSEHIAGMLEFQGYRYTPDKFQADVVVLNTCSVREKAERRVYGQVEKLHSERTKRNSQQKIFLTGCMPAYAKEDILQKLPYLDGFIDLAEARTYPPKRMNSPEVWVTIMSGCNNFCSYCIVPYTRGREKSRPVEDILVELSKIDFSKYEILFLLGQNVNSYAGGLSFPQLLEKILWEFPQIPKLGFLTSHPKDISDELIEVIARQPRIDREIHFPLQSGNDRILELMNRGYTYAQYKALTEKLRAKIPGVRISTDLIVGFPSETEAEFEDTLKAIREIRFHRIMSAAYSPRAGTKAAEMPQKIPTQEIAKRLERLNNLIKQLSTTNCG